MRPLRQHPSRSAVLGPGGRHCDPGYKTPRGKLHSRDFYPAAQTDAGRIGGECTADEQRLIAPGPVWSQALPFQQFHVLFNSLSKVLFIFRSLYLSAIGLWPIFSFRWNLPPILSCIPKQLDSSKGLHTGLVTGHVRDSHPLRRSVPRNLDRRRARSTLYKLQLRPRGGQISNLSCCRFTRRY